MRILIETIPHAEQRYDTVGDWVIDPYGTWHIKVSELPTKFNKFAFLVAFHELIEMALCSSAGVTAEDVDRFDMHYAGEREEPGDDPDAPYHAAHQLATGFERTLAALLSVDWEEYGVIINSL